MKELAHLNKYFFKYKFYLFWGIVFTLISNLFGIVPAQVVRHALEMVKANIDLYFLFENSSLQVSSYKIITFSIAVFGVLILAMAILKGIFLFAVRQTLIVMSRHIEYDLKNEIYAHYQTLPLSFYKKKQYRRPNGSDFGRCLQGKDVHRSITHVPHQHGNPCVFGIELYVFG